MVKYFFGLTLFLVSCTKENEEPINLPVTLTGEIFTTDEFGYTTTGQDGVEVTVEGTSVLNGITDAAGKFTVTDLSTGTYNLAFSKEGFGTQAIQGLPLIGGDVPIYLNVGMIRKSTTQLSALAVSTNNGQLVITGKVNHTYPYNTAINGPRAIFFLSKESNVSGTNYEVSFSRILNYANGASFNLTADIDTNIFPGGTTVYILANGVASYDNGYMDIETNTTVYPTLSDPSSNVVSIQIP